jgi:hypothetical protein
MKPIVIIPAAGKSSRFNGKKPKWLRTHPDGRLMIDRALDTFSEIECDRYLITTNEINNDFDVINTLKDACPYLTDVILINSQTNSAVDTVLEGLKHIPNLSFDRPIFIKDTDNYVKLDWGGIDLNTSFTVGFDLKGSDLSNITNKSYLVYNDMGYVTDFVEKKIISDVIGVGTHYIKTINEFMSCAIELNTIRESYSTETYISHLISLSIYKGHKYKMVHTIEYEDYGTQLDWDRVQNNHKVIFCDFDGTLVENKGRYGKNNWFTHKEIALEDNINVLKLHYLNGAQIVITTSRCGSEVEHIKSFLRGYEIEVKDVITDCLHSPRYLINDFAYTNPYPSAVSINIPRNGNLKYYI